MDCENKYKEVKNLIDKTTAEPLTELEKTDIAFTVEEITESKRY